MFGRRVVRPWLGLKMIDLNDMIISQLKERDSSFPSIKRGILVPMVCILVVSSLLFIKLREEKYLGLNSFLNSNSVE